MRGHSVTSSIRVNLQFRSKWFVCGDSGSYVHTKLLRDCIHPASVTNTFGAQTLTVSAVTALITIVHRRYLMAHYVLVLCAPCVCNFDFLHACV